MSGFGLRMEWLRYAVIWLVHPNILHQIAKVLRAFFCFADGKRARLPSPPGRPRAARPKSRAARRELSPCSSAPVLVEFSLEGGRNDSGVNANSSCKNLRRDADPNQSSETWREKIPQVFIPARVETIRLKTMEALNADAAAV